MNMKFNKLIYLFALFCIILLTHRLIRSDNVSYVFLIWNLFLAFIPCWISNYITLLKKLSYKHVPLLIIWLLFLPNAPYILTDLFHLKTRAPFPLWYDLVLILSFALCGLCLFFKSLKDMFSLFNTFVKPLYVSIATPFIFWIISFGLYLGRYMRLNSWNIIHPFRVLKSSYSILWQKDTLAFTVIFSVFMWFLYTLLIQIHHREEV